MMKQVVILISILIGLAAWCGTAMAAPLDPSHNEAGNRRFCRSAESYPLGMNLSFHNSHTSMLVFVDAMMRALVSGHIFWGVASG
ncbi:hypothetical protein [Candidatus Entotheonella palauensis]|uniref:hypothetical protein n=1 Tax=Candidatus Entotheonella palauensis TaxID=93172 RepID=UPI000B7F3172|nr:hypothetical protein [Candidatus Entotheonella palauensis]